jgi:pimeloyl-ACP methyl ester carboxylesterase
VTDAAAGWTDEWWWSRDGLRLHFRDYPGAADRPAVLCLPGLTRNARDFATLAGRLAGRHRVICPELRGRGESGYARDAMSYVPLTYLQDVEGLLLHLGLDRVVAIGTSLGGILTLLLASTDPDRIAGAVLNDVGPAIEPKGLARIRGYVGRQQSCPTWLHAARTLADTHGAAFPDFTLADWIDMAKRLCRLSASGRIVADYDPRIAEPFRVPGGEAGVDLWPTLGALAGKPVLLVRGELSDVLSASTAARMAEALPQMERVEVARTGHAPSLDEPECAAAIDRLLERVEADGAWAAPA